MKEQSFQKKRIEDIDPFKLQLSFKPSKNDDHAMNLESSVSSDSHEKFSKRSSNNEIAMERNKDNFFNNYPSY